MRHIHLIATVFAITLVCVAAAGCSDNTKTQEANKQRASQTASSDTASKSQQESQSTLREQDESSVAIESKLESKEEMVQQSASTAHEDNWGVSAILPDSTMINDSEPCNQQNSDNGNDEYTATGDCVISESDSEGQIVIQDNSYTEVSMQDAEQNSDDSEESMVEDEPSTTQTSAVKTAEESSFTDESPTTDESYTEESSEESAAHNDIGDTSVWAITTATCTLSNGATVDGNTYLKVLENDISKDMYIIQWYDSSTEVSAEYVHIFEVPKDKEVDIILRRTAGVITNG